MMIALQDEETLDSEMVHDAYQKKTVTIIKSRHSKNGVSFKINYRIGDNMGRTDLNEVLEEDEDPFKEESDGLKGIL
jgi:hypothetical protein